jgi:NADH dehydrogenase
MKLLKMECCEDTNCIDVGKICLPKTDLPRVVVIGGGFAGLALVNKLRKQ